MPVLRLAAAVLAVVLVLASASSPKKFARYYTSLKECAGRQKYTVTFYMGWTKRRFGSTVPDRAMISPLTAFAHSRRFSPFAMYSYATPEVETVAESGNNKPLIAMLRRHSMVGSIGALSKPTRNNGPARVTIHGNAHRRLTHVSAIAMLAPTPDWITAINNLNVCNNGRWAYKIAGFLYAYDAGTEKTPGVDQQPRQNIYRLLKPRYPRYEKYPVGWYVVRMAH